MKTRILLLMLILSFAVGCGRSEPSLGSAITVEQQADAQASMGLTFPLETRWLLYHRLNGLDDAIFLKVEVPASALGAFLAQPQLAAGEWRTESHLMQSAPEWPEWQPSTVTRFRYAAFELPHAEYLRIMVDDDVEEPKVVYLFWHET